MIMVKVQSQTSNSYVDAQSFRRNSIPTIPLLHSISLTNTDFGGPIRFPSGINKRIVGKIINKFYDLQSLYVEYNALESDVKWKAIYRSGFYSFTAVKSTSPELEDNEYDTELQKKTGSMICLCYAMNFEN